SSISPRIVASAQPAPYSAWTLVSIMEAIWICSAVRFMTVSLYCSTRKIHPQQLAKFLARFEEGNSLRRHVDSRSGFRIASDASSSLARVEASESTDFNLVAGS